MTSSVAIGHGTLLQREDSVGAGTYTTVAEVISVTPPNPSRDAVEVTHTSSTGRVREFISGLIDFGEVTAEVNFIPGSTADDNVLADINSTSPRRWKILYASNEYVIFPGFVTGYEPQAPIDDRMTATVTFKVSGAPTYS